jgi:hypothetical protein
LVSLGYEARQVQLPKDVLREMKEVGSSYKHLPSATDQAWITRWLGLDDGWDFFHNFSFTVS